MERLFTIGICCLLVCLSSWGAPAHASYADDQGDAKACAPYGGYANIVHYGLPVSLAGCRQWCPQCIQYCYVREIACRNGQLVNLYSQVKPYRPEAEQSQEWSNIQSAKRNAEQQFSSAVAWRPLSPYPQFVLIGFFIIISTIAWFGRVKDGTGLRDWGLNIPLNAYLALSLATFNTALDSDPLVQTLDQYVFFHSWFHSVVLVSFFVINAMPLIRGWDYLFVKHPAADIVNSAVDAGTAIHGQSLARALWVSPQDIFQWRPRWHYEHQAEKARKLREKLDRDTELARAAIARERARAELHDEKRASAEDMRERVWRGRTF